MLTPSLSCIANDGSKPVSYISEWSLDGVPSFSPSRRSSCLWPMKSMSVPGECN